MKASELLRAAKPILVRTRESEIFTGICSALIDAAYSTPYALQSDAHARAVRAALDAKDRVRSRIRRLLNGRHYLFDWLTWHGHVTPVVLNTPEGWRKLRVTRLAWIDDLIVYFESKGD